MSRKVPDHPAVLGRALVGMAANVDMMLVGPDGAGLDWQVSASAAMVFRLKIQAGTSWITVSQWTGNTAPARFTIPLTQQGPCSLWADPGAAPNLACVATPWGRDVWQDE